MGSSAREQKQPRSIFIVLSGLTAGGSERVASLLGNHWAGQGRAITIVAFDSPDTRPYFDLDSRVLVHQLGLQGDVGWLRTLHRIRALRRLFLERPPDLVVSFLTKINVVTLLATRGLHVPVIVSERNNPAMQKMNPVWLWARDRLYPTADALIAQSKGVIELLPLHLRSNAIVIPNPIAAAAIAGSGGSKVVAAVGRLTEQKGFDLLLRAAAQVSPSFPDWSFVVWGDGEERGRLQQLSENLGLAERVRFPGTSKGQGEWQAGASIFVLSSRYEGFPNALGEAMAAGMAAIAFDCPFGPSDLIEDGVSGLLVEPQSIGALASALRRVMEDETLRHRLIVEAKARMARFSPERIFSEWDKIALAAVGARSETIDQSMVSTVA